MGMNHREQVRLSKFLSLVLRHCPDIRANQGPDLEHTLNYLTLPDDPMRVTGPDQLEVDAFYRYNGSIQRFFNGATQIPTEYSR